ncbi:hypothetical protein BDY19DRAFT_994837 [Irpex rosettiformis]|uniref:Uncharacterized protein n=1 Tax=Irpex rosettiformis TaxID=378272 RepID=A0ACB8TZT8_9APHY|nr:hypothetical protein BDY19DRAFT_994837 [Irpex rosettiformis]
MTLSGAIPLSIYFTGTFSLEKWYADNAINTSKDEKLEAKIDYIRKRFKAVDFLRPDCHPDLRTMALQSPGMSFMTMPHVKGFNLILGISRKSDVAFVSTGRRETTQRKD